MLPTVKNDSVFLIGVVDAHERRVIQILDIAHAFLCVDNDEHTLMLLHGKLCELSVQIDPTLYRRYVITLKIGCWVNLD